MSQRFLPAVRQLPKFNGFSRSFSTSPVVTSGHSRWSKIKHDKGKADAHKSGARQELVRSLTRASKYGGPDPAFNAHLPGLIASAKRNGMPKAVIEAAIARGQGVSASGQALESVNVEFLFPESNIAGILECQTDNKNRLMQVVNEGLKHAGATNTTVSFMFDRMGKIVFTKQENWDEETILDQAIEAGASDVNMDEEGAVILTEATELAAVAEAMSTSLGAEPKSRDLVWLPKSDMTVDSKAITQDVQAQLDKLFEKLEEEDQSIQETYLNLT